MTLDSQYPSSGGLLRTLELEADENYRNTEISPDISTSVFLDYIIGFAL